MIAGFALLVVNFVDLHAIAAASSAGFLLVFAMVSLANAKLARATHSKAWISISAAVACFGALGTMLFQSGNNPQHRHELTLIGGLTILPFLYQLCYRAVRPKAVRNS
jgi:uncharacterized protein